MTTLGWIFMLTSVAGVFGGTFYCFWRVLSLPEEVAEQVKDFHSA